MERPANLFLIPCEHHICHLCAFPLMDIYEKRRRQIAYKGPIARAMASIDSGFSIAEIIFKIKILLCPLCRDYGALMYSPNNVDVGLRLRKYEHGNRICWMCKDPIDSIVLPCNHSELCYKCLSSNIVQEKDVKIDEYFRIHCPQCGEQCRAFFKKTWTKKIWKILFQEKIKIACSSFY